MDDLYIEAWNGLGTVYWMDNLPRAREHFQKAYDLTLQHFKGTLPKKLNWGLLENRQYLRAIQNLGLVFWREQKNSEAMKMFTLLLQLNPDDNQGTRYLVAAIHEGLSWEKEYLIISSSKK